MRGEPRHRLLLPDNRLPPPGPRHSPLLPPLHGQSCPGQAWSRIGIFWGGNLEIFWVIREKLEMFRNYWPAGSGIFPSE